MLPHLKDKKVGVSAPSMVEHRSNDEENIGLLAAAEDLLRAIEAKDLKSISSALKAAFEICDAQPHVEGPHE